MRKWIRNFVIMIGVLSGSLILATLFLSQITANEQQDRVRANAQDLALLDDQFISGNQIKTKLQQWLSQNDLILLYKSFASSKQVVVSTNATKDEQQAMVAYFKQHAPKTGSNNYFTAAGQQYLLHTEKLAKGEIGVVQQQWTWYQLIGKTIYLWLLVCLMVVVLYWYYRKERAAHEKLTIMTRNVQAITEERASETLILHPSDDFFELNTSLNALETKQQQKFQIMTTEVEEYHRLIDHLTIGILLINNSREVTLSNQAINQILGGMVQSTPHPYVDDIRSYQLSHLIEKTFKRAKTQQRSLQLVVLDNEIFVDATTVYLENEQEPQVMVLLYDVTNLKQLEQMQLDFVSNASHELKTPVTAITGFAETLLAGAKDDPKTLNEFLMIIAQESHRLTALIQDILELAKVDQEGALVAVDLQALVEETLKLFSQQLSDKKITVNNQVPVGIKLVTNPRKLTQIMKNLLINGILYNQEAGSLTIEGKQTEENLIIQVTDTGVGIATDEQNRIFERFYRVDHSRNAQNGGTGLGLAITKEEVENLGGTIEVTSQLGVGSTFTVTLPTIGNVTTTVKH